MNKIVLAALALALAGTAAAQETKTWTNIGKGLYRDDLVSTYYVVNTAEWEVDVEECDQVPGLYCIINPYLNCPYKVGEVLEGGDNYIMVHAEDPKYVWLGLSATGLKMSDGVGGEGYLVAYSVAGDYYENVYGDFAKAEREGMLGKMEDRIISFTKPNSLLVNLMPEPNAFSSGWLQANHGGLFRLRLPGAPLYEASVGAALDGTDLVATVTLEKDVERALVAVAQGDDLSAIRAAMLDGSLASTEITQSGSVRFPLESNDQYTVMVIPFYGGEPKTESAVTREYAPFESEWHTAAEKASFTDGILSGVLGGESNVPHANMLNMELWTGAVEVQYNTQHPGQIRLVDPFGPTSGNPYANNVNYDSSKHYYMELNISNPACVTVAKMEDIGLTLPWGLCQLWGRPDYGVWQYGWEVGDADYLANGGTLNGTSITFPQGGILAKFPRVRDGRYDWYWANYNLETEIVLPQEVVDASGIREVEAAPADGAAVYYNLQGQRVAHPTTGVYVKVCGGKATKVVL